MPTFDPTYSTGQSVPGGGMTLDEIMQRRRDLARTQLGFSQVPTPTIAGGIGNMISAFTTGLQESQARQQEAQGRQALAGAFSRIDPNTGQFANPQDQATAMMLDPEGTRSVISSAVANMQAMAMEKQREQFTMDQPHTPAQWVEYGAEHGKYGDLSIPENKAKYEADRQAAVSTGIKEAAAAETAGMSADDFTNNVDAIKAAINKGALSGVQGTIDFVTGRGAGGIAMRQMKAGLDALRQQMIQAGKSPAEIADTIQGLTPAYTDDAGGLLDKVDGIKRQLDIYGAGLPGTTRKAPAETKTTTAAPKAGDVVDGYRFKGGDPNDQKNWEPAG